MAAKGTGLASIIACSDVKVSFNAGICVEIQKCFAFKVYSFMVDRFMTEFPHFNSVDYEDTKQTAKWGKNYDLLTWPRRGLERFTRASGYASR